MKWPLIIAGSVLTFFGILIYMESAWVTAPTDFVYHTLIGNSSQSNSEMHEVLSTLVNTTNTLATLVDKLNAQPLPSSSSSSPSSSPSSPPPTDNQPIYKATWQNFFDEDKIKISVANKVYCDDVRKNLKDFKPTEWNEWQKTKLWPLPLSGSSGSKEIYVSSESWEFILEANHQDLIANLPHFQSLLFEHGLLPSEHDQNETNIIHTLIIGIEQPEIREPYLGINESYILSVPEKGNAVLCAQTYVGALHGLQTFGQLVHFDFSTLTYSIHNGPWTIVDSPQHPHRGLLLDTARHWEPLAMIHRVIQSLAYNKMNVFHWHMSDDESFPLQSKKYPNLWKGAHSEDEKYTQADVAGVIEFARERGIRVIVEFDTPAHAKSWCVGYPQICVQGCALHPLLDETYQLIDGLYSEMMGSNQSGAGLFPDRFFHSGGDEVRFSCWENDMVQSLLGKYGLMNVHQAFCYFLGKIADLISQKYGRRPIMWEDVWKDCSGVLPKEVIVHTWLAPELYQGALSAGRTIIFSNDYYLDWLDRPWTFYYDKNPWATLDHEQFERVIGGEACMWSEKVDASNVLTTIWPRAAAIAERFWSPTKLSRSENTMTRYTWWRCELIKYGVAALPTNVPERQNPPGPSSCYDQ